MHVWLSGQSPGGSGGAIRLSVGHVSQQQFEVIVECWGQNDLAPLYNDLAKLEHIRGL